MKIILLVLVIVGFVCAKANDLVEDDDTLSTNPLEDGKEIFRNLVRPFRMEKLNLVWVKAQQVKNNRIHLLFFEKKKRLLFIK